MLGPGQLRVKRKRNEPAPDTLIVEPQHKRAYTDEAAALKLKYVRQQEAIFDTALAASHASGEEHMQRMQQRSQDQSSSDEWRGAQGRRRIFLLARSRHPQGAKRKQAAIATLVETSTKRNVKVTLSKNFEAIVPSDPEPTPFKRPGRSAVVARAASHPLRTRVPNGAQQQERLEALANDMHQFTLDELASVPKPKVTAVPKLSAARSRDLHRQRVESAAARQIIDHDMADAEDEDYIYDTYVLAPVEESAAVDEPTKSNGDIGYLILTEDDQSIWEAYIEDETVETESSDDDDENAEGHYGADYPEDELGSDDEFDRNAYGYRRNGDSDNEEWDEDTGNYSGDEEEKAMRAWRTKTPGQFAKYLDGKGHDGDGDEGDD